MCICIIRWRFNLWFSSHSPIHIHIMSSLPLFLALEMYSLSSMVSCHLPYLFSPIHFVGGWIIPVIVDTFKKRPMNFISFFEDKFSCGFVFGSNGGYTINNMFRCTYPSPLISVDTAPRCEVYKYVHCMLAVVPIQIAPIARGMSV